MSPPCCYNNNRISYQVIASFILLTVLITTTTVIKDKDVIYEKIWHDFVIFFDILLSLFFIFISLVYIGKLNYTKYTSFLYYLSFISSSIFLLAFGTNTILEDEVNQDIQRDSPDYYFLNLINDNISIGSILLGFVILFLTLIDFLLFRNF